MSTRVTDCVLIFLQNWLIQFVAFSSINLGHLSETCRSRLANKNLCPIPSSPTRNRSRVAASNWDKRSIRVGAVLVDCNVTDARRFWRLETDSLSENYIWAGFGQTLSCRNFVNVCFHLTVNLQACLRIPKAWWWGWWGLWSGWHKLRQSQIWWSNSEEMGR